MKILSYLSPEGKLSNFQGNIPNDILINGYKAMLKTRIFDEKMVILQRQGSISFCLSSLGEEACAVASAAALEIQDWVYPQYREAGIMFWRGFSLDQFVNHMFCNSKDNIYGRQMPNHFGSRELNVVQVSSPIGTKIPHCAGCAYAMKLQNESCIAICYFGEGATSEGDFHAGLNFAAVRKVPAIFFCRNNHYAISTPVQEQFASDGVAPKGAGYGVTTYKIDGNDFFAIYETIKNSRKECLEGKGPIFIEAMTYRLGAHSTSDDPTVYRKKDEVDYYMKLCPIKRLKAYLILQNLWNEEEEKKIIEKFQNELDIAIENAKTVSPPSIKSLFDHVYFSLSDELRSQYEELQTLIDTGKLP